MEIAERLVKETEEAPEVQEALLVQWGFCLKTNGHAWLVKTDQMGCHDPDYYKWP